MRAYYYSTTIAKLITKIKVSTHLARCVYVRTRDIMLHTYTHNTRPYTCVPVAAAARKIVYQLIVQYVLLGTVT